ncbi:potassium-transporting ATPase subunit KdpA [Acidithrix ferrooxidans]|uniref:Potassium-transporting ATPase potassium-binding subunit n=1 Tax=Acidithrix ferrooxidans TaxID=1280514 RepID=A0A0D8HEN2_9ACTN|nr:potassium-transporting ATPase subunit KdpA [Acidithrix ferrooxidans]KJF16373.1 potassium-transporting ATPase A chain [Acidithrix ferrooxidans]
MNIALTILALLIVLGISWRYLGSYLEAVFEGRVKFLSFIERRFYKLLGVDPEAEQSWQSYARSLIIFSVLSIAFCYGILRLQAHLPLNQSHLPGVPPALAWNTAVSFITNTNWQNYAGETTMTYLSQMMALVVPQFTSAAVGIAAAIALSRGFSRKLSKTIGNFWVDITRVIIYVLLPVAFIAAIVFMGQGAVQTFSHSVTIRNAATGFKQTIPLGPVASLETIKQFGTNGGGYFNANGAHPFEDPTAMTAFLSVVLLLAIPVSLTYTFGKMIKRKRTGLLLLATMAFFFFVSLGVATVAEKAPSPVMSAATHGQVVHAFEGKESRFGIFDSVLYDVASTQTSTGSINSQLDSYSPVGGAVALGGMMLGEVSPGGVGSGLYTILAFAIVTVFIAGLMVGRTPEFLGKKIQAKEIKLASIAVLIMPIVVLVATAIAVSVPAGRAGPLNAGPHGFSEILYAITSQGNNNGSAFGGLSGNTAFYNIIGGVVMLLGRFGVMIPVLALSGSLAAAPIVGETDGTLKTDSFLFGSLLVGVIVIVGALSFFPVLSLGPIAEALSHGRLF